jgi:hypothetical protein
VQRATLKEDDGADPRSVMDGEPLEIGDQAGLLDPVTETGVKKLKSRCHAHLRVSDIWLGAAPSE